MAYFQEVKEIDLSDTEAAALPNLLELLATNSEIRSSLSPEEDAFRFGKLPCFRDQIAIEHLIQRLNDDIIPDEEAEVIFLEKEQAALSAALVLGLSITDTGEDLGLTRKEILGLIKQIHMRAKVDGDPANEESTD